jgi:DNA-binding PadR family transcriptional regulator
MMQKQEWFLTISDEIGQVLNEYYLPALMAFLQECELEGIDLWTAQTAVSEHPYPITPATIQERTPYTSTAKIVQQFANSAERGLLTAVSDTAFELTAKGQQFVQKVPVIVQQVYREAPPPIPTAESERLADLLRQLVEASLNAAEPDIKAAIRRSRFYDPGRDAPMQERIRRYLNDLAAFRDDVHLAAWQAYGVTGPEWEAFSHVQGEFTLGEKVATAVALTEKLDYRGLDTESYEQALQNVAARGWLESIDDAYHVTDKGHKIRQTAEKETNRLFYTPWSLSEAELNELKGLMEKFRDGLQPPAYKTVWELAYNTRYTIGKRYNPILQEAAQEIGLRPYGLFLLMHGHAMAPAPITADSVRQLIPYISETLASERLSSNTEAGFLTANGNGYHMSEKGNMTLNKLLELVTSEVAQMDMLPATKTERLAEFLTRLSDAAAEVEEPSAKPSLDYSRHHLPGAEAPPLLRYIRAVSDLGGFRDDVYMAAWQAYEVEGYQWEAFSHIHGENIWDDKITTAEQAAEKFEFRGYNQNDYEAALTDCVSRGWLTLAADHTYTVTETGQKTWQEAEDKTDQYFYAPWQTLNILERFELHDLLMELDAALTDDND